MPAPFHLAGVDTEAQRELHVDFVTVTLSSFTGNGEGSTVWQLWITFKHCRCKVRNSSKLVRRGSVPGWPRHAEKVEAEQK